GAAAVRRQRRGAAVLVDEAEVGRGRGLVGGALEARRGGRRQPRRVSPGPGEDGGEREQHGDEGRSAGGHRSRIGSAGGARRRGIYRPRRGLSWSGARATFRRESRGRTTGGAMERAELEREISEAYRDRA